MERRSLLLYLYYPGLSGSESTKPDLDVREAYVGFRPDQGLPMFLRQS